MPPTIVQHTALATQASVDLYESTTLPLDIMLRDRSVCGISDPHLQQPLLSEKRLSFQRAYDIAVAAETAQRQQKELRGGLERGDVHLATTDRRKCKPGKMPKECYRCTGNHRTKD